MVRLPPALEALYNEVLLPAPSEEDDGFDPFIYKSEPACMICTVLVMEPAV